MPRPPAPLIAGLVDGNTIQPRTEAGLAVEAANIAEDFNEDFLGDIGGVGGVLQAARNERVKRLRILTDEYGKRFFRTGLL